MRQRNEELIPARAIRAGDIVLDGERDEIGTVIAVTSHRGQVYVKLLGDEFAVPPFRSGEIVPVSRVAPVFCHACGYDILDGVCRCEISHGWCNQPDDGPFTAEQVETYSQTGSAVSRRFAATVRQAWERINALEAQVLEQSFALAVTANDAETIRRQRDEIARLKGPCNMGTPREDHRIEPCGIDCDWQ